MEGGILYGDFIELKKKKKRKKRKNKKNKEKKRTLARQARRRNVSLYEYAGSPCIDRYLLDRKALPKVYYVYPRERDGKCRYK